LKHGVQTYYCTRACQLGDWKKHKKRCGIKHADGYSAKSPDDGIGDDGWKPLFMAAKKGHVAEVRALILAGVDVNKASDVNGMTPLFIAANYGHETVVRTLIKVGADVNQTRVDDVTPLCNTAATGHDAMVRMSTKQRSTAIRRCTVQLKRATRRWCGH
jgi:hypothetical protein